MSEKFIQTAKLEWNEKGTPVSSQFDDVYFSNVDGLQETEYVFLKQNHLPQRWHTFNRSQFVAAETGFGTGLNFLALWRLFEQWLAEHPDTHLQRLHFISFEKYPLSRNDLIQALSAWPILAERANELIDKYPLPLSGCHRIELANGRVSLDLWLGDVKDSIPQIYTPASGLVDCWFLDGFAPSKNPDMWQDSLFQGMAELARQEATVATFTAAGFVRRGLIHAGFDMQKVKGFGTKRDMIAGTLAHKGPRQEPPDYRRNSLQLSAQTTEIAVIGGGIAALTSAQALLKRGFKVHLYAQSVADGASGNRQGAVYPLLNGLRDPLSRFYEASFGYAVQYYQQQAESFDFSHDWCGMVQLGYDEKSQKKIEKILSGGFPESLCHGADSDELGQHAGVQLPYSGLYYPPAGWVSPKEFCQGLYRTLEQHPDFQGHLGHQLLQLSHDGQDWKLDFETDTQRHEAVILCLGHQLTELSQAQGLPVYPVRGQVSLYTADTSSQALKTVLCYDGYCTPAHPVHQTHCIGASYGRNRVDLTPVEHENEENLARFTEATMHCGWHQGISLAQPAQRVAVRSACRDHLPLVGQLPYIPALIAALDGRSEPGQDLEKAVYSNLYLVNGLGSRGLCSAPLLAEVLASQLAAEPIPLPESVLRSLAPSRFWLRKLLKRSRHSR